jgi:anti-sigma B factor antagonist
MKLFRVEAHGPLTIISPATEVETLPESMLQMEADRILSGLRAAPPRAVILDLGAMSFFGSAFISVMLRIHKLVRLTGGKLVLAGVSERVKELLQLTSLNTLWTSFHDRAEALAGLVDAG